MSRFTDLVRVVSGISIVLSDAAAIQSRTVALSTLTLLHNNGSSTLPSVKILRVCKTLCWCREWRGYVMIL